MKIFTAQMSKYKNKADALDITVKSGDKNFAPSWEIVSGWKKGEISWEEYTRQYIEMMRASYRRDPEHWHALLRRNEITLLCYCPAGENCHRFILVELLQKLGKKLGIEVEYGGERAAERPSLF
jgi:uncharacterized protein YeaO (DUF488 family)